MISERGDGGAGALRQAEALRAEGIEVREGRSMGRTTYRVALERYGWFPLSVDLGLEHAVDHANEADGDVDDASSEGLSDDLDGEGR